jgi:arsenate reductase
MPTKKRVLFLCTGNAARSQMAEGLMRAFHGDVMDVVSAGSRPAGWVHPLAIGALAEIGIDISSARSKPADQFLNEPFDVVVTVCDSAALDCPLWPGAKRIEHWPIGDPSFGEGDGGQRFAATRDELARRIEELMDKLEEPQVSPPARKAVPGPPLHTWLDTKCESFEAVRAGRGRVNIRRHRVKIRNSDIHATAPRIDFRAR